MSDQSPNPYAAPKAPLEPASPGGLAEDACPRCRSRDVKRPTYTWWGGAVGPKLFSHAVCRACGFGFDWKTGQSNATRVGVYLAINTAVAVVIIVFLVLR